MNCSKQIIPVLSALALGIGGLSASAQGTTRQCISEECACEEALAQNTVEALEEFLSKYPQSINGGDSACAALAVTLGGGVLVPEGQSHDDSGTPEEPVATPSEG